MRCCFVAALLFVNASFADLRRQSYFIHFNNNNNRKPKPSTGYVYKICFYIWCVFEQAIRFAKHIRQKIPRNNLQKNSKFAHRFETFAYCDEHEYVYIPNTNFINLVCFSLSRSFVIFSLFFWPIIVIMNS